MRRLLSAVLGAALIVSAGAVPTFAAGETRVVSGFQPVRARKSDPLWCWAACVQTCVKSAGGRISQDEALKLGDVRLEEAPALEKLPPTLTFDEGRKSEISLSTRFIPKPLKRVDVIDAFEKGRLIVADMNEENPWNVPPHVVIVYGYRLDLMNEMHLKIYDPWPPGHDREEVPFREDWGWRRTVLFAAVRSDSADKETYYKDPPQCISLAASDIQWGPNLSGGNLYYVLTYENVCEIPVMCTVTVQSGNQVDGFLLAGMKQWVLSQSRSQVFVLMPGSSYTLRGTLRWRRPENGDPRVMFPSPSRGENLHLIHCEFLERRAD